MLKRLSIIYTMTLLTTGKRVQVIASLSVEQLGMDLPEGEKEEVRSTKQ
jgi:hypothetical protein